MSYKKGLRIKRRAAGDVHTTFSAIDESKYSFTNIIATRKFIVETYCKNFG